MFSTPLPSASYSAHVTVTSTAGFDAAGNCSANDNGCYFFDVTSKTASGFTIEMRRPVTGALQATSAAVTLDYFAIVNK